MADHVLLVGMMGAGKTTVGRLLAQRLGMPHCDSDAQIVKNTGMTVPEIFEKKGEAAFRAEEKKALAEAVASSEPVVVSVAGGAVLDSDNQALLKATGFVVWLRAELSTIHQRVGRGEERPLLADEPRAVIAKLYPARAALYEELADLIIDTDDVQPEEIVEHIVAALP